MSNTIRKDLRNLGISIFAVLIIAGQAIFIATSLHRLEAKPKAQTGIFLVEDCNTPPRC